MIHPIPDNARSQSAATIDVTPTGKVNCAGGLMWGKYCDILDKMGEFMLSSQGSLKLVCQYLKLISSEHNKYRLCPAFLSNKAS